MAHLEQRKYMSSIRDRFPERFNDCRVLDIGSLDINGNNRFLFNNATYIGLDIGQGPNVDVVCRGHEYKSDDLFDIVISSECFEHDEFWNLTIQNAIDLLRPDGLLLFTCATTGRPEHGTRRTSPVDSPFTSALDNDYYMNLAVSDIIGAIDMSQFSRYSFEVAQDSIVPQDLYFWGIKK